VTAPWSQGCESAESAGLLRPVFARLGPAALVLGRFRYWIVPARAFCTL